MSYTSAIPTTALIDVSSLTCHPCLSLSVDEETPSLEGMALPHPELHSSRDCPSYLSFGARVGIAFFTRDDIEHRHCSLPSLPSDDFDRDCDSEFVWRFIMVTTFFASKSGWVSRAHHVEVWGFAPACVASTRPVNDCAVGGGHDSQTASTRKAIAICLSKLLYVCLHIYYTYIYSLP